jgi:hypothetical protein
MRFDVGNDAFVSLRSQRHFSLLKREIIRKLEYGIVLIVVRLGKINCPLAPKIGHRAHLPYIDNRRKFQRQRRSEKDLDYSYERKNALRI